jgi:diaminohydroxyphosphoribosylaminopyrimidine deaminase/5-amino-6-(5-phosphoribosylamino)uracil reductase
MIGAGTAVADDPVLTDRSGKARRKPLVRVVLDERLATSADSQLVRTAKEAPLIILTGGSVSADRLNALASAGVEVIEAAGDARDMVAALKALREREIQSVLVEGGANVAGKLLDAGLADKVSFFLAPLIIGGRGAPTAVAGEGAETLADAFDLQDVEIIFRGNDIELTGYPRRRGASVG